MKGVQIVYRLKAQHYNSSLPPHEMDTIVLTIQYKAFEYFIRHS